MKAEMKTFDIGITFESNTIYSADKTEYHIYLGDAVPAVNCWFTQVTPQDPEVLSAFVLRGLENVTIDLNNAKLIFHGRVQPFALEDCRNITFKNFSIDYDRPFFTQGTVTDMDEGSVTLEIPDMFRYRVEHSELIAMSENWERSLNFGAPLFQPYDARTQRLSPKTPMILAVTGEKVIPQENPPCPIYELKAEQVSGQRVRLNGTPPFFKPDVGEIVAFTHENRHKNGFQFERCEDITVENVRLLHISSMGLMANLCHNITLRNFSCYSDKETGERIISVNADVIHGFHSTGRVLVENCRFENMLDDAFNFHGNYTLCEVKNDAHTFISINRSASMYNAPIYLPGDTINLYRGNTQELKAVYTIVSAEYLLNDPLRQRIEIKEPLFNFRPGDLIESQRMPEIIIRNCRAGHARGGYRISSGNRVVMEDCHFENTPIMFTGDTNYWYENAPVRDVTIRDNVFEYFPGGVPILASPIFTSTSKAPYYHKGIRVLNNHFMDCRKGILNMRDTDGIELLGNEFNDMQGSNDRSMVFTNCINVVIR